MGNVFGVLCFLGSFVATLPLPIQIHQTPSALSGVVQDETNQAIAGVKITLHSGELIQHTLTNEVGRFHFDGVPAGDYRLDFDKGGFFRLSDHAVTTTSTPAEILVTLNHEDELHSRVDVVSTPHEVVPEQTGHEEELVAQEIRQDP